MGLPLSGPLPYLPGEVEIGQEHPPKCQLRKTRTMDNGGVSTHGKSLVGEFGALFNLFFFLSSYIGI